MERQALKQNQQAPVRQGHVQRNGAEVSPARLVGLQSAIGNQAMRRLIDSPFIQAKLEVSQPEDPSEKEADRVADTVMRMPDTKAEDEPEKVSSEPTPDVQAKLEDEEGRKETVPTEVEIQRVPLAVREDDGEEEETSFPEPAEKKETVATKPIQDASILRQSKANDEEAEEDEDKEQRVQAHSASGHTPQVTPSIANNIHSMSGSGSPLPPATRAFFEPRFGSDFSGVRIHTDSRAAETAKSLQARAFTVGNNIAFGSGQYAPESQTGRHLLAHELTHVVQQSGGQSEINSSPLLVQRGPGDPPDPPPPGHPPPLMSAIELKGKPLLELPTDLADYIKSRAPLSTWVAVKFGTLMSNEIPIYWSGTGFNSTLPPAHHDGHPMPISHPDFPLLTGARPMLGINIREGVVSGFFGWQTSKTLAHNPEKFFEKHPLNELFALEGMETDPPVGGRNQLSGGKLDYSMPMTYTTGDFEGEAEVNLKDEKYDFKGELWVNDVKGIDKPMPIKKEGGKVFGNFTWKFNRSLGVGGKLSGEIVGTFAGGKPDVRGTLNYTRSKPQISGTVEVLITSFENARNAVSARLGDVVPTIEPAGEGDRLAITGWGHLDFAFNEWLTGNAEVIVHPEGYVTAAGEIVPTVVIPILKQREKTKELFNKEISKSIPGLDIGLADISVVGSLKIDGYASLGAGTLHDLRVAGLFSTHPGIVNTFDISGIISTPAVAGIKATAEATLASQILKTLRPVKAGVRVTGKLELQLYAEAAAAAGQRKGEDGEPEYFLKGTLKGSAGLRLDLNVKFFASVLFWEKDVDVTDRTYMIAGRTAIISFDYTIGKKKQGEDALKFEIENIDSFDQNAFAEAVLRSKTAAGDKAFKGKEQQEGTLETVPNPDAPPPVEPPDPNAPTPPGQPGAITTLEEDLKMENVPHRLEVTIADPAEIMMESAVEPLLKKINRARTELNKRTSPVGEEEKKARLAELTKIEKAANTVQESAERAAKNPAFITPRLAGFTALARLIGQYGDKYDVTDLGAALESIIVDPKKPETVLREFPGLASDSAVVAQVAFLIKAGISAPDLRVVVEKVRPQKEDEVRKLIDVLERMIRNGAANWDKTITDLKIGGNKYKGARFVLRYIDTKLGWNNVAFEVTNDPVDASGRRWDARVAGQLYQFKSWYTWPDIASRTFLRQILEDYRLTRKGQRIGVSWVFETSLTKDQIVQKMKDALAGVIADLKAGKDLKVPGYTEDIALFISNRVESIVTDVIQP